MPGENITFYAIWEENSTGAEDNNTDNNDTTATEDTADRLPQTRMYVCLIVGFMALVAGVSLIILGKDENRN